MEIKAVRNATLIEGTPKEIDYWKKKLTLTDRFNETSLPCYKEGEIGTHLIIPNSIMQRRVDARKWEKHSLGFKGTLRDKQQIAADKYLAHVQTYNGGILKMPTGSGKTVVATDIICKLGLKSLVIVPTDYLMGQWVERLKTFSNIDEVGIVRSGVCNIDAPITVAMLHSLSQKDYGYRHNFYNEFGLVAWDEVHTLSAPTFSSTAMQFWSKYRLGLSATPRRKDGMENVFLWNIGGVCHEEKAEVTDISIVRMPYKGVDSLFRGGVKKTADLGRFYTHIAHLPKRNAFVADAVYKLYAKDRDILVLSDRIDQLNSIRSILIGRGVPQTDIGMFTGKDKANVQRKVLLGTYGSAGLGTDLSRLNTLVLATPRSDVEQSVGRILRGTFTKPPMVVDIVDSLVPDMVRWAAVRERFYRTITKEII